VIAVGDRATGLKVLSITGDAENAILGNGPLPRGIALLTKPFAMDNLAARIRPTIESGTNKLRRRSSRLKPG
jgi:DNA-binding response OmpR family regulator